MTKIIIYLTRFAIALILSLWVTSCQFEIQGMQGVEGNKIVKTEPRDAKRGFTAVHAKTGLDVEIVQGEKYDITVIADENLLDYIQTEIVDNVLIIQSERNIKKASSKRIIVTMPKIEKIKSSSGASMTSQNTLTGNDIHLATSSGSSMSLILEFDQINAESSSGSSMNLEGKCLVIDLDSSSGSKINAEALKANIVHAESSSGSSISTFPIIEFTAKASSGSSIVYYNTPKMITQNKNSGASISSK
jgi:hypothetical protein